jgi:hypothetical protein
MKKVRTSAKGRVCKYRSCKNLLSIYNHELYCHIHQLLALQAGMIKASGLKGAKR